MVATVAMNVFAAVMTSSPDPTPSASSVSASAAVPDDTPTAPATPQYLANQRSKASVSSPPMKALRRITPAIAASSSGATASYWDLRSTNLIERGSTRTSFFSEKLDHGEHGVSQ